METETRDRWAYVIVGNLENMCAVSVALQELDFLVHIQANADTTRIGSVWTPKIDLLVLDENINEHPPTFIRRVRQKYGSNIPAVMLASSCGSVHVLQEIHEMELVTTLNLPVRKERLSAAIGRLQRSTTN